MESFIIKNWSSVKLSEKNIQFSSHSEWIPPSHTRETFSIVKIERISNARELFLFFIEEKKNKKEKWKSCIKKNNQHIS